ncbi:MarR family winged helix-turn-helix transcriptional regulator [Paenibacillus elgii]
MSHDDSLTRLMRHVLKLHRHSVDLMIQKYDVFPGQPPLLMRLSERDGQSQKELADSMLIKPPTLTVMINRMEKTGLVERKPDPDDQRVSRVYLTGKGRQAAAGVQEALQVLEAKCFEHFNPEEKMLFRRLLWQVRDDLETFQRNFKDESLAGKQAEDNSIGGN